MWASPSCTKHSVAQGKRKQDAQPDLFGQTLPDEAAERSRATMWDVVRFAEYHHYDAVVTENVVEVYFWPPFQAWMEAMRSIGYHGQIVYLNSMHAQLFGCGAPQSRDRIYIVFTRIGAAIPKVLRVVSPAAVCPECGPVRAVQAWKNLKRQPVGKYRTQYVYRCPRVECRNQIVEPVVRPAADIIDWSLTGTRIGDRKRPLADKTIHRIEEGIRRYWQPILVPAEGRDGKRAAPTNLPARTMTSRAETALALPAFIAELRGGSCDARAITDPLSTVTASGNHHALISSYFGTGVGTRPVEEPLSTVTTVERHALITPAGGTWRKDATPSHEPIPTRTTRESDGIAFGPVVDLSDVMFRMLEPCEVAAAMDFPSGYQWVGTRRIQVRLAGNAVTPPAARDIIGVVVEALTGEPVRLAA